MKNWNFTKITYGAAVGQGMILGRRPRYETQGRKLASVCINSFTRRKRKSFAHTRFEDLSSFFSEYADPKGIDLNLFREQTARIIEVFDELWRCFGSDTKK